MNNDSLLIRAHLEISSIWNKNAVVLQNEKKISCIGVLASRISNNCLLLKKVPHVVYQEAKGWSTPVKAM